MEFLLFGLFFCVVPLLLIFFGVWIGRGAPGIPYKLVKRDAPAADYYDEEEEVYALPQTRGFSRG